MIKQFNACWIPDLKAYGNLTGLLTSNDSLPVIPIGILSRFKTPIKQDSIQYEVAVILSGPEPQRTIMEEIVHSQISKSQLNAILVRGVVDDQQISKQEGSLHVVNFLQSDELVKVMAQARIIIARSGYSTVMDLAVLQKNAILIPTPGQTEQEYLAQRLKDAGICYSVSQHNFDLIFALDQSKGFTGFSNIEASSGLLDKALDEALSI
jgi:UDP-N-acetylglucosamine transferase subunit ALG13